MQFNQTLKSSELQKLRVKYPQIQYLDAFISDVTGYIRGKRIPIDEAEKIFDVGLQLPESSLLLDSLGDSSDPCGRGFSDGDPDGTMHPIPGTCCYVPWGSGKVAQVLMSMFTDDGEESLANPRTIATRVIDTFNQLGYQVKLAFEIEFYLIDNNLDKFGRPQTPLDPKTNVRQDKTQVYSLEDLDMHYDFLDSVRRACQIQSIPASVITSEYAPSQYEINLQHVDDLLSAADHCILLKRIIREVAFDHQMRATFMPKPFSEFSGNGLHVHMSLENESGENLFRSQTGIESELMRHAIGGLLETFADFMAIFAPGRNSFRRFIANNYVPMNQTWGYNNRSVAIRIPAGDDKARRLEHRVAGADANPYLVLAAILAGVHHGITNKSDPGKSSDQANVSETADPNIPFTWDSAIEVFRNSVIAQNYLSRKYVDLYCEIKKEEMEEFENYVSSNEYRLYL